MEKTMEIQTHLEPDLHCAGFLLTKGYNLIGLEKMGRRFAFLFSPEAHAAAQEYRSGGGMVVARDFADAINRLKDELYSAKFAETTRNGTGNGTGENGQQQYPRR